MRLAEDNDVDPVRSAASDLLYRLCNVELSYPLASVCGNRRGSTGGIIRMTADIGPQKKEGPGLVRAPLSEK
jgi:hypothetical protein